jgi:hypothetical protein
VCSLVPLLVLSLPLVCSPHLYLWASSLHDDTIPTFFPILPALNRRALLPRQESFAPASYVSMLPSNSLSCVLISRLSSVLAVRQYGRNKDKGKAREVKSTPSRGVTSPSAESRKEPSVNDTLRTINGHRAIPDSGTRDVSEPPLHSPVSQKAPKSPSSSNPRASTDAITHVSHSRSHTSTDDFLSIMLSQRLAELASANAEGLLEYVVLMKRISDLGD